jgi:hypothetical protein
VNLFTICISKGYVYLDYGRNVKNVMKNASKDIVYRIILIIYIYLYEILFYGIWANKF